MKIVSHVSPRRQTDVETDTKTSKRMEGIPAEDEKKGEISSTMVDDGPTSLTSFDMIAEPPAPEKCIGDTMLNNDAEAPKPCLPPMEVRLLSSAAGGLSRHSLYSDEEHASPTASVLDPQRQDQEENQPDKLQSVCPSLLEEGLRNKIKANSGV